MTKMLFQAGAIRACQIIGIQEYALHPSNPKSSKSNMDAVTNNLMTGKRRQWNYGICGRCTRRIS